VELTDRLELLELPGRYGDLVDDRNWAGLDRIFLDDATFEFDRGVMVGLAGIREYMAISERHPRTHLMTNIYVDETDVGVVLRFRLVAMLPDGRIRSGRYRDVVVKTADGWRVASRVMTETPYEAPAGS
jgi:hypothetical protein